MTRVPALCSQTTWCCWVICILVVVGQSMFADSKPIHQPIDIVRCHNISRNLVNVVTETLSKKDLDGKLNCSYENAHINDITKHEMNTIRACLPSMHSQSCICSKMNRTEVDEDKCLTAIHSDLKSFKKELHGLNPALNEIIKALMQALNAHDEDREDVKEISCSSISCKLQQCETILAFQLRTITISRMLSYLKEEDSKHHKTWTH